MRRRRNQLPTLSVPRPKPIVVEAGKLEHAHPNFQHPQYMDNESSNFDNLPALNTLAWNDKIGPQFYFVGF